MRSDSCCIVGLMSVTTMAEWQMVASRVAAVAVADSVAIVADSQSRPGLYWAHNTTSPDCKKVRWSHHTNNRTKTSGRRGKTESVNWTVFSDVRFRVNIWWLPGAGSLVLKRMFSVMAALMSQAANRHKRNLDLAGPTKQSPVLSGSWNFPRSGVCQTFTTLSVPWVL